MLGWMLVGCAPEPESQPDWDPLPELEFAAIPATGSSTVVARGATLYAVNAWDGTVARTDVATGESEVVVTDGEPTRIAAVGDALWVTLRSERSVLVLDPDLTEVARIPVGAEPYGILSGADRVWVAVSQQDEVLEIDPGSREVLRAFPVHDEPRWLALHPSGDSLYVVHGFDDRVTRIDLDTGGIFEGEGAPTFGGTGDVPLAGRGTGDPTVSPDGDALAVPVLYADHLTQGAQPSLVDGQVVAPALPYYTSIYGEIGRLNPAVVFHPLDPGDGRLRKPTPVAILVTGSDLTSVIRGYLSSLVWGPDGSRLMGTLPSSDTVLAVDLGEIPQWAEPTNGFQTRFFSFVDVAANPTGIAVTEDGRSWVLEGGSRSVAELPVSDVVNALLAQPGDYGRLDTFHALRRLPVGESLLDPGIEAGRALFWSAVDPRVTVRGVGVSCETCHQDGRTDGLTWQFDDDPRQTPSLVGGLSETLPLTWTDQVETVEDEALLTSIGRMGGQATLAEASRIAAFLDQLRPVDVPDGDPDLVALGAEIAARPEVGCSTCHGGPRLTDNATHELFGKVVNTPSLQGVSATPPYFHDGSAATLRDVLEGSRDGTMGDTSSLDDLETDALEAWLSSL